MFVGTRIALVDWYIYGYGHPAPHCYTKEKTVCKSYYCTPQIARLEHKSLGGREVSVPLKIAHGTIDVRAMFGDLR